MERDSDNSTGPPSNIDRFESAYNEIDELIRKFTRREREVSFGSVLREYEEKVSLGADGDFLRSVAALRNVLVHSRRLPHLEMAVPTEMVVAQLETIRDRMLNPPRVFPRYQKQVTIVAPEDSLEYVMKRVSELDFSQFPVMDGDRFIGLLTENGITRWLAKKITGTMSPEPPPSRIRPSSHGTSTPPARPTTWW